MRCSWKPGFSLASLILWLVAAVGEVRASTPVLPLFDEQVVGQLELPESFQRLLADRALIDEYQLDHYRVDGEEGPKPLRSSARRRGAAPQLRIVRPELSEETLRYRASLPTKVFPPRGFRAPILANKDERPSVVLPPDLFSLAELRASETIKQRLAADGLLSTLVEVLQVLGPETILTNTDTALSRLSAIGYPVDLLSCFPLGVGGTGGESRLVLRLAQRLQDGMQLEELRAELREVSFRIPEAWQGFRVATESGEGGLQMLRLQFGGGFRGGIIPGDNLDVIGQLLIALPDVEFLISVPAEYSLPFQSFALPAWRTSARTRVTLLEEPFTMSSWAQDSGKAGFARKESHRATLAPRYASLDEEGSAFVPLESFVMDGLIAAGEHVVHSPLLFQGGNLLAVREPATGRRLLLLGEADLYRNLALGLTRDQALQLFEATFGVDQCVVLPAVSFHLDFDLSVRAVDGKMVAFVNDQLAAARLIVQLGTKALAGKGLIPSELSAELTADLNTSDRLGAVHALTTLLIAKRQDGRFPGDLANAFVDGPRDSATGNFQTFLQALDLLAAADLGHGQTVADSARTAFLKGLQHIDNARRKQIEAIQALGWRVVNVPSMPNYYRSLNSINGVQHDRGYLMPAAGGFYAPVDQAAEDVIRRELGDQPVTRIQCAELQRYLGGVHCVASAYFNE